jgi:hypothetical protein
MSIWSSGLQIRFHREAQDSTIDLLQTVSQLLIAPVPRLAYKACERINKLRGDLLPVIFQPFLAGLVTLNFQQVFNHLNFWRRRTCLLDDLYYLAQLLNLVEVAFLPCFGHFAVGSGALARNL